MVDPKTVEEARSLLRKSRIDFIMFTLFLMVVWVMVAALEGRTLELVWGFLPGLLLVLCLIAAAALYVIKLVLRAQLGFDFTCVGEEHENIVVQKSAA